MLAELSSAAGVELRFEGLTDEPAAMHRAAFQPDRYGDRWAPVLLAWADPTLVPELDGGLGTAAPVSIAVDAARAYVSGAVVLDDELVAGADRANQMLRGELSVTRAILLHEFGHLLGLDHSDDPSDLMHASPSVFAPSAGDLAALAATGAGACFDEL